MKISDYFIQTKAVRSTQNLEMPVSEAGKLIVDRQVGKKTMKQKNKYSILFSVIENFGQHQEFLDF